MGLFLSGHRFNPITTKVSSDELNEKLISGSSSMQGYRITQEDAHNCILDYDTNTSLFAVYDGHGSHAVSRYCSQYLPDYIKSTDAYKEGNLEKALVDGFLGFDATIETEKVREILQQISKEKSSEDESDHEGNETSEDDEENLKHLYEEAHMPIEQVIEKYQNANENKPMPKRRDDVDGAASSSSSSEASSSRRNYVDECAPDSNGPSSTDAVSSSSADVDSTDDKIKETAGEEKPDNSTQLITSSTTPSKKEAESCGKEANEAVTNDVSSSSSQEGEKVVVKGKGKAIQKTKGVEPTEEEAKSDELRAILDKREEELKDNMQTLYKNFLARVGYDQTDSEMSESSEDEEEEDESAEEKVDDDEEEDEKEEDDAEEDDDEEEDDDAAEKSGPGFHSGSTAVMALLRGNQLFVANTGDSRCILCRNGQAVDMSIDHTPENAEEKKRILAAGGKIEEGRVNGGLNLSRAIGDFVYKNNPNLTEKEQMITALPDVKVTTIKPGEDQFMVVACDGIWNEMSSQEVVDFIRPKLESKPEKVSKVVEEMFDYCLRDKSGMDNMTAIIVQFRTTEENNCKRPVEDSEEEQCAKKTKTESNETQVDTTLRNDSV